MTWIQTHSGLAFDLLKPKADQIYTGDIVHALARIARFTGHTKGDLPYSVAVHSVHAHLIAAKASPADYTARLWALLHDAHEAYVGDISTPMKEALGFRKKDSPYDKMVRRIDLAIARHFGLTSAHLRDVELIVKRCDFLALQGERAAYMAKSTRPWKMDAKASAIRSAVETPPACDPTDAESLFSFYLQQALRRFRRSDVCRAA